MNNELREKPYFFKRIVAYIIDFILVTLLSTSIMMVFFDNTNYQRRSEQMLDLTRKVASGDITREEYSKQFDELNYYLTKEGISTTIVNCSVAMVYYVVLCFFCHGITLGKYLMKLRIVSANDKELNIGNYLIRGLFVNLILSNLVSILFIYTMSKETFVSVYPRVSSILSLFLLVTILFIMYRNDGKGLHDLMSNTVVISTKVPKETIINENNSKDKSIKNNVSEANVIKEKKIVKKSIRNNTKKEVNKK